MTYLDTHAVVWLYRGERELFSEPARDQIEKDDLLISPMVLLELEYLHEIQRLKPTVAKIVAALSGEVGLKVCELPFPLIMEHALDQKWVRDPFDRIIVAHASAADAPLVTKDETIGSHYRRTVW